MTASRVHAMTCDVEDYFQVSAFDGVIPRERWNDVECRIPRNVDNVLQIFADHGIRATFFTLGWVAENHPEVVRRIVGQGHELASHGMAHFRVWSQKPQEFQQDVTKAKMLLEDVAGVPVIGFRAASWSIDNRTPWAYEILAEAGYTYSSSVYPVRHDHYGVPDAPREPHEIEGVGIKEIPPSTVKIFGRNIPASGGGYFRLFPLGLSKRFIDKHEIRESFPYMFYFHPWELDPDQPKLKNAKQKARFRHYLNLKKFEGRLRELVRTYRWGRVDEIYMGRSC